MSRAADRRGVTGGVPEVSSSAGLRQLAWFYAPACVADASPIVARRLLPKLGIPLDGGRRLRGHPLLGGHKTWRGLATGVAAGAATWTVQRILQRAGWLQELSTPEHERKWVVPGVPLGLGALLGDAAESFAKRRLGLAPGESSPVFDQVDFIIGAMALERPHGRPTAAEALALVAVLGAWKAVVTAALESEGWK